MDNKAGLREEISDLVDHYGDLLMETVFPMLAISNHPYRSYLVYDELKRIRPQLSKQELIRLAAHHVANETEFYKRILEPDFNEK